MANYTLSKAVQTIERPLQEEIDDVITSHKNNILTGLMNKRSIIIDKEKCKKVTLTIFKIITSFYKDVHLHVNVVEGSYTMINYPANGSYFIVDKKLGDIFIKIKEKTIEISTWYHKDITANEIFEFIKENYKKSFGAKSNICYYLINATCRWEFTVARPLETEIEINHQIRDVIDYLNFRYQIEDFKRTGIMLHGPSGTGKSKIVEYMASRYGMNVYLVSLDEYVNNTALKKLFMEVPKNSIIAIDEMHSQLERIRTNRQKKLDASGILTAIDGPGRLAYNVFVIITTNSADTILNFFEVEEQEQNPLIRPGRIDKTFKLDIVYEE